MADLPARLIRRDWYVITIHDAGRWTQNGKYLALSGLYHSLHLFSSFSFFFILFIPSFAKS
jgi:hypothetical protein